MNSLGHSWLTVMEAVELCQSWGEEAPLHWQDVEVIDNRINRHSLEVWIECTIKDRGARAMRLEEAFNREHQARVCITAPGCHDGKLGTVYGYLPGYLHPWLVRPDGYIDPCGGNAGIAFTIDEIELLDESE